MSNANEVGTKLVALCQQGKGMEAVETLYAPDIVSVESADFQGHGRVAEGIDAVRGKSTWWYENHDVHESGASGPYLGHREDQFAVHFNMDVTFKPTGEQQQLIEVGLYTVANGKIVQEEFLYHV